MRCGRRSIRKKVRRKIRKYRDKFEEALQRQVGGPHVHEADLALKRQALALWPFGPGHNHTLLRCV